jgi:hypothetical protein
MSTVSILMPATKTFCLIRKCDSSITLVSAAIRFRVTQKEEHVVAASETQSRARDAFTLHVDAQGQNARKTCLTQLYCLPRAGLTTPLWLLIDICHG